jgi:type III secretion protein Y
MSTLDRDAVQLLHSMGALYLRSGQQKRALIYLLLAIQIDPVDAGLLRSLANAFIATCDGGRALAAIGRLEQLEGASVPLQLLRSRALWAMGAKDEARRCFREYLNCRRAAACSPD